MPEPTKEALLAYVDRRQEAEWGILADEIPRSINRIWSMKCDWTIYRILEAQRITGTWTQPNSAPWALLWWGVYAAITEQPQEELIGSLTQETISRMYPYCGEPLTESLQHVTESLAWAKRQLDEQEEADQ